MKQMLVFLILYFTMSVIYASEENEITDAEKERLKKFLNTGSVGTPTETNRTPTPPAPKTLAKIWIEDKIKQIKASQNGKQNCIMCYDEIENLHEWKDIYPIVTFGGDLQGNQKQKNHKEKCRMKMHAACLNDWCIKHYADYGRVDCPNCRQELLDMSKIPLFRKLRRKGWLRTTYMVMTIFENFCVGVLKYFRFIGGRTGCFVLNMVISPIPSKFSAWLFYFILQDSFSENTALISSGVFNFIIWNWFTEEKLIEAWKYLAQMSNMAVNGESVLKFAIIVAPPAIRTLVKYDLHNRFFTPKITKLIYSLNTSLPFVQQRDFGIPLFMAFLFSNKIKKETIWPLFAMNLIAAYLCFDFQKFSNLILFITLVFFFQRCLN